MEARKLLDALHVAEKLKDETRHCTTTKGAPENVASHSWRMALMAYFMTDEFPALDMDKVIKMCLIPKVGSNANESGTAEVFKAFVSSTGRDESFFVFS